MHGTLRQSRGKPGQSTSYCDFADGAAGVLELEPPALEAVEGFFLWVVFFGGSVSSTMTFLGGVAVAACCCRVRTWVRNWFSSAWFDAVSCSRLSPRSRRTESIIFNCWRSSS